MANRSYRNKTVVITGASGGLGTELCLRFGAAGARIVATDFNKTALTALNVKLAEKNIPHYSFVCNITDEAALKEHMNRRPTEFLNTFLLINNVGITHIERFKPQHSALIKKILDVNVMGCVYTTAFLLEEIKQTRGQILNLSSVAGFAPLLGRTGYSASKFALHGFFESLRTELAEFGVSVGMISPSFIDTGIGEDKEKPKAKIGKVMTPDIAADLIFKGAEVNKRLILIGRTAKISWWLRKFAPRFYERKMSEKMKVIQ